MRRKPHVVDVRQIGPDSERFVSGRCSECGDYLLATLSKPVPPRAELLTLTLEALFKKHLADCNAGAKAKTVVPVVGEEEAS
jgi:hypothetical protein